MRLAERHIIKGGKYMKANLLNKNDKLSKPFILN